MLMVKFGCSPAMLSQSLLSVFLWWLETQGDVGNMVSSHCSWKTGKTPKLRELNQRPEQVLDNTQHLIKFHFNQQHKNGK